MADDGMLLNFEIGNEPLKQQVKFTGGRWRDRKRAVQGARLPAGDKPKVDLEDGSRTAKRRRIDEDAEDDDLGPVGRAKQRVSHLRNNELNGEGGRASGNNRPHHPIEGNNKGPRQVISRLFSYNPAQKTVFDEPEEAWSAPEATNAPLELANFGSLSLSSRLVEELSKMKLERPTAIQKKVIPHLLSGEGDAFVQAETGSGKTFSYLLPILHRVLLLSAMGDGKQVHRDSGLFAIIVAPTRELARQTHTVLEQLIRPFPWLVSTSITGGESKKSEKARIRKGVNFLVATPGRLADHIDNTQALTIATVRWLVLDEGDRLMDLGFEDDLKKTISALKRAIVVKKTEDGKSLESLPDRRVTVLCSATMKMNVQKLGEMSLADATFLAADKNDEDVETLDKDVHKAPAQLHQSHVIVPAKLRLITLISYLRAAFSRRGKTMKTIIFVSCADSVNFLHELLKDPKADPPSTLTPRNTELVAETVARAAYVTSPASPEVVVHRMHGSLAQTVRTGTLRCFSDSDKPSVLITTDVSSRGLDIPSVDLVIEYDPAFSFSDHIHRVGRTARAGRPGDALLFLQPGTEEGYIELLKTSTTPTAQSYDSILQKGMLSKLEFPVQTSATPADGTSLHGKAETLQLHVEQRLLADEKLLDLARNAFKSHIRAYATHVKEERVHFDISELHLGHMAKSFGLREAPGGIGHGIDRKSRKPAKGRVQSNSNRKEPLDRREPPSAQDVIKRKSMMLMNAGADEFNIG